MEEAPTYFALMCARMRSHLRGHVLEVGCGSGVCTRAILDLSSVARLTAIDKEEEALWLARARIQDPRVTFERRDLHDLPAFSFDSILCANVLEHIEDDRRALESLKRSLKPGGTLALLVPAHPVLYARYDAEAGHFRRYTRRTLRRPLVEAGFAIDRLFSFNMIGAIGWFLAFKVLQRRAVSEGKTRFLVRAYERFALPLTRMIESIVPVPFGLSMIALCRRGTFQDLHTDSAMMVQP